MLNHTHQLFRFLEDPQMDCCSTNRGGEEGEGVRRVEEGDPLLEEPPIRQGPRPAAILPCDLEPGWPGHLGAIMPAGQRGVADHQCPDPPSTGPASPSSGQAISSCGEDSLMQLGSPLTMHRGEARLGWGRRAPAFTSHRPCFPPVVDAGGSRTEPGKA